MTNGWIEDNVSFLIFNYKLISALFIIIWPAI